DGQRDHCDAADKGDENRNDAGENRAVDEEMRDVHMGAPLLRLRRLGLRGIGGWWKHWFFRLRDGLHGHAGLEDLEARGNDLFAVLESALHDAAVFEKRAGLEVAALDGVVGFDDIDVFHALLRTDDAILDEDAAIRAGAGDADAAEKARREKFVPAFEDG